jgi:hypothetical protein
MNGSGLQAQALVHRVTDYHTSRSAATAGRFFVPAMADVLFEAVAACADYQNQAVAKNGNEISLFHRVQLW